MNGKRFAHLDAIAAGSLTRRTALRRLGGGLLATGLTLGPGRGLLAAQDAATPEGIPPVLEEFAAAWSAGDLDRLTALYTDDAVFEEVPFNLVVEGKDAIRAHFAEALSIYSDLTVTLTSGFRAGDRAAAEGTTSLRYTGQLPGLPPGTGQPVEFRLAEIFELEGDRIRRETEYYDFYGILVQLGVLPPPGAEGEMEPPASPMA